MTERQNTSAESSVRRNFLAWLLFPLALFPLVALLTYDWRAMPQLNLPPLPSASPPARSADLDTLFRDILRESW